MLRLLMRRVLNLPSSNVLPEIHADGSEVTLVKLVICELAQQRRLADAGATHEN